MQVQLLLQSQQPRRIIPIKEKVGTYRMFYLKPGLELVVDDMRYRIVRVTDKKVICRCVGKVGGKKTR